MRKYTIIKPDPTLQNNLMAFGFMCQEGWYPLIEETLDQIQDIVDRDGLDVQITEVKEKYGGLRIYVDGYTDEIGKIIEDAERKSVEICELCGKDGKQVKFHGWWMTRCQNCLDLERKKYDERMA